MQKDAAAVSLHGYKDMLAATEPGLDAAGLPLPPGLVLNVVPVML